MTANTSNLASSPERISSAAKASPPPAPLERIRLWDLPLRLFHWLLVAAVAAAVLSGKVGGNWVALHGKIGLGILGLVVFRVMWGFLGSTHSRFAHFFPTPGRVAAYLRGDWKGVGHNPLGAFSVFALLGLLTAQGATGLFTNDDISFTGPLAGLVDEDVQSRLTGIHHLIGDALLILIGVHVLAIVFYRLVKKDNLVRPLVTGVKEVDAAAAAHHPQVRGGGVLSFVLSVAVAVGAVVAANGYFLPKAASTAVSTSTAATSASPS